MLTDYYKLMEKQFLQIMNITQINQGTPAKTVSLMTGNKN